jgi:hypothetical protein
MNAMERKTSPQFWIWGFVFLFLVHAFAIFWFAERRDAKPLWQKPSAFLYLSSEPAMDQRVRELAALQDPTLFALPHPHGFSGGAWLNFHPQIPTLNDTSAPPAWLALPLAQLGGALNDYALTNRPSEELLLASLRATKTVEVRIPDEPVITNTTLRIEGPLAARRLLSLPLLPSAAYTDVLRQTVVAVSVNGDGIVETASLAEECGLNTADARAVELARRVQFEPAAAREARARAAASPILGRLIFTWHIVLPTNAGPATASAR